MVVMAMVAAMATEVMVMVEGIMEREMLRQKLLLSLVTEAMVMVMEEVMEVMVDTEAMEDMVMARERLKLSQVTEAMAMVVMVMEEVMEVMVDTEAMVMESKSIFYFQSSISTAISAISLSKFLI